MKPVAAKHYSPIFRVFNKGWQPAISFILPLLIYLQTLAPTVYNLDSAELTLAAATLGITRATGYPLYMLVGHAFSKIPIADVGYRLNLLSAVCGALTILFMERILSLLKIQPWIKFPAILILATAHYFWYLSSIAEVYTLNTALMALFLWRILCWDLSPTPRNLFITGLALGLNFTHHGSAILLLPGVIWHFTNRLRSCPYKVKSILIFSFAALLPFLLYAYLPIRYLQNSTFNYAGSYQENGSFIPVDLASLDGFFWLISAKGFQNLMFGYPLQAFFSEILSFWQHIARSFWYLGVGPGIVGIFAAFKKNKGFSASLVLIFVSQMLFFSSYRVVDKQTMFLPADLIWTIWFALGVQQTVSWLHPKSESAQTYNLSNKTIKALMITIVCLSLLVNFRIVDQSNNYSTKEAVFAALDDLPRNAAIIGYWDMIPAIQYYQSIENIRPDVEAVNRFLIGASQFDGYILQKSKMQEVFFSYRPADLPEGLKVLRVGDIYKLVEN